MDGDTWWCPAHENTGVCVLVLLSPLWCVSVHVLDFVVRVQCDV